MFNRNLLLFIFLIAFSPFTLSNNQEDEAPGLFDNIFQGLQIGINYGNLKIDKFSEAKLLGFEARSTVDDDRYRPQGVAIGYLKQKEGNKSKSKYRGTQDVFYLIYDYGYRVKLSRKFKPYILFGLGYAYTRQKDFYQVDTNGFALGTPKNNNSQGLIGYAGLRYTTKFMKRPTYLELRYWRGVIQGTGINLRIEL